MLEPHHRADLDPHGQGRPTVLPHRDGRPARPITRAEREVAELVAVGASNPEIARSLGVSRHTVESHLKHLFVKLGLTSRVQLAVLIVRASHPASESSRPLTPLHRT